MIRHPFRKNFISVIVLIFIMGTIIWFLNEKASNTQDIIEGAEALRIIYESSVVFIHKKHVKKIGEFLPPQFPPSVDWTPKQKCWIEPCSPQRWRIESGLRKGWLIDEHNNKIKEVKTWKVLGLKFIDSFYYQYKYTSKGIGTNASFTALARGGKNSFHILKRSARMTDNNTIKGSDLKIIK